MMDYSMISKLYRKLNRNKYDINGKRVTSNKIHLEWWNKKINVGDQLAPVIFNWMLSKRCIRSTSQNKLVHLMTLGSLIGMRDFDSVIWGSGIHCLNSVFSIIKNSKLVKYDIRAVRGPITKKILQSAGYECDPVCGDPGVLMPLIYNPNINKRYDCSVIMHLSHEGDLKLSDCHIISVETDDYRHFIDEIVSSKYIISSSLHGIILAEAYGIPAVFWNDNMENEFIKYYDYYFSTNRNNVVVANSISEAMNLSPMQLPNLDMMRRNLIDTFPFDLFVEQE